MNPAAGQYSSLSDLITVTQTLLNPRHSKSQITQHSMNKWLHSVHTFEEDDWTEMGFVWEIIKAPDSNGRLRKIYWKCALTNPPISLPCITQTDCSGCNGWLSRSARYTPRDRIWRGRIDGWTLP